MYRRYRERRRNSRRYGERPRNRRSLTSAFRSPATQIAFLLIVALVIFLILQAAGH
jgi:nitrogen fixation/metabolism regulation signal transduction histidine kinase